MPKAKVSCPHLGNYWIPLSYFFRRGLNVDYVVPPPITRRTITLGSNLSPTEACTPFKITLGTYLEALEAGADTLVATGGVCRLNFYGELQEFLLRESGKSIHFVDIQPDYAHISSIFRSFRAINPQLNYARMLPAFATGLKIAAGLDAVEAFVNAHVGVANNGEDMLNRQKKYLSELQQTETYRQVAECTARCLREMEIMPLDKSAQPIRVGIIGEFYTLLDPASNHQIERKLTDMGVEVHRFLNVTNALVHYPAKVINRISRPYMADSCGVTTRVTVGTALFYAQQGYDGIVHVKSFGCMPEVDAMPFLQNVSQDCKIPILSLSYDVLTEDEGLQTRLEAFCDMLAMRRIEK